MSNEEQGKQVEPTKETATTPLVETRPAPSNDILQKSANTSGGISTKQRRDD